MHRCGGDKQQVFARRRVKHLVRNAKSITAGNAVTAAVVNTEIVFGVSGGRLNMQLFAKDAL